MDKIDALVRKLCIDLNHSIKKVDSKESVLELSYAAHFHLVSILSMTETDVYAGY